MPAPAPMPTPAPINVPPMPWFFAASFIASAAATFIIVSVASPRIPSLDRSSSAFSTSAGTDMFSMKRFVRARPISRNFSWIFAFTISLNSMVFPARSSAEILLSPSASVREETSMVFRNPVISSVLNVLFVPKSSFRKTAGSSTLKANAP